LFVKQIHWYILPVSTLFMALIVFPKIAFYKTNPEKKPILEIIFALRWW